METKTYDTFYKIGDIFKLKKYGYDRYYENDNQYNIIKLTHIVIEEEYGEYDTFVNTQTNIKYGYVILNTNYNYFINNSYYAFNMMESYERTPHFVDAAYFYKEAIPLSMFNYHIDKIFIKVKYNFNDILLSNIEPKTKMPYIHFYNFGNIFKLNKWKYTLYLDENTNKLKHNMEYGYEGVDSLLYDKITGDKPKYEKFKKERELHPYIPDMSELCNENNVIKLEELDYHAYIKKLVKEFRKFNYDSRSMYEEQLAYKGIKFLNHEIEFLLEMGNYNIKHVKSTITRIKNKLKNNKEIDINHIISLFNQEEILIFVDMLKENDMDLFNILFNKDNENIIKKIY